MTNIIFRIIKNIKHIFHKYYARHIFIQTMCNIDKIIIGPDCNERFFVKCPKNLSIGDGTVINGDCYIQAYGGVSIGRYCHVGKGLTIFSHNHNYDSNDYIPYDGKDIISPVFIGDFVWIGANVLITPGVKIGEGVVIAGGCVVVKDVPDCAVIGGNPHRIIKFRDIKKFNELKNLGRWA